MFVKGSKVKHLLEFGPPSNFSLPQTTNRRLNINTSIHLICEFMPSNDVINIKEGAADTRIKMMPICGCRKSFLGSICNVCGNGSLSSTTLYDEFSPVGWWIHKNTHTVQGTQRDGPIKVQPDGYSYFRLNPFSLHFFLIYYCGSVKYIFIVSYLNNFFRVPSPAINSLRICVAF